MGVAVASTAAKSGGRKSSFGGFGGWGGRLRRESTIREEGIESDAVVLMKVGMVLVEFV